MYQFKTFHSGDCNGDFQLLESRVNAWIAEEHPRIRLMSQTPIANQILLSFVFEVISEVDDQPAISITAVPEVFKDKVEDTTLDPNEPPAIDSDLEEAR